MSNIVGKTLGGVTFSERDGKIYGTMQTCGVNVSYELKQAPSAKPVQAILMDLDGTTLTSEEFWMYVIELTVKKVLNNPSFTLQEEDVPHVSGFSTIQHLVYCFEKYAPDQKIDMSKAVEIYHGIAQCELDKIMRGQGRTDAFKPTEGLKEFLSEVKARGIKIALVTSGAAYKAIPEITSVFRTLNMGDPLKFYDSVITGGCRKDVGDYGTLGEVACKPHPWVYTEVAYMGLKVTDPSHVLGIEDSAAGAMALRFAGFPVVGLNGGNISASGLDELCVAKVDKLSEILKLL